MSNAFFKALISITDDAGIDKAKQVWTGESKHRRTEIIVNVMNWIKQTMKVFCLIWIEGNLFLHWHNLIVFTKQLLLSDVGKCQLQTIAMTLKVQFYGFH